MSASDSRAKTARHFRKHPVRTPAFQLLDSWEFFSGTSYANWRSRGTKDWLLILTVDGRGLVGCDGPLFEQSRGDAVLYEPNVPQTYGTDPDCGQWHTLTCHFQMQRDWQPWVDWPLMTPGLRHLRLNDADVLDEVCTAMRTCIRNQRQSRGSGLHLAANIFERALMLMHDSRGSAGLDARVRKALDILRAELHGPLVMSRLAQRCGLSVSRLAHLFQEQMGVPPQRYHQQMRLEQAERLLRTTNSTVAEIADSCGYQNAFYFSTRFKQAFGQSPSAFRKTSAAR